MPQDDDIPNIPPAELDMAIDEDNKAQGRGPERRAVEQGIADMQERIRHLTEQLRNINHQLNRLGSTAYEVQTAQADRARLQSDLREANERLAGYQAQLGKN